MDVVIGLREVGIEDLSFWEGIEHRLQSIRGRNFFTRVVDDCRGVTMEKGSAVDDEPQSAPKKLKPLPAHKG
jgi:hypothetical protein